MAKMTIDWLVPLATRVSGLLCEAETPATVFYQAGLDEDGQSTDLGAISIKTDQPWPLEMQAAVRGEPSDIEAEAQRIVEPFILAQRNALVAWKTAKRVGRFGNV